MITDQKTSSGSPNSLLARSLVDHSDSPLPAFARSLDDLLLIRWSWHGSSKVATGQKWTKWLHQRGWGRRSLPWWWVGLQFDESFFFRNMGPLGSRPRCSVLVYAYLCKYATRIRAQKGFLFVQHPNIGNFNSSEVKGVTALYFQTSTKIEKILWLPDCRSTPPQLQWGEVLSTSLLLFQQWPGAFNKWGSFKCLPSFQANSYVRSQTTNNQHSSSKNPRLTDSRQKRAQKKYRSGGPLSTRSLFEGKKQRIERAAKTRTSWTHALHMSGKFYFWSNS